MNAYAIRYDAKDALEQTCAIEIATGCSIPTNPRNWPAGLLCEWNKAAEAGAFDGGKTIGDMARAFLRYRLKRLEA